MIYQRTPRLATEKPVFSARPGVAHLIQRSDKEKSMKMLEIEVSVGDGYIDIIQYDGSGNIQSVVITPEQAELVCKWIMGAAESLHREA